MTDAHDLSDGPELAVTETLEKAAEKHKAEEHQAFAAKLAKRSPPGPIDREDRWDELGVVNTVADPDYVTASASRERLELASEAGSLSFALDAAETIQARDSLEKMLVHQMAVLHRGMMRAAIRMNEEISRLNEQLYHLDEGKREAANVRACRLAGAISRLSATYQQGLLTLQRKRTGGSQHVTVKHIHQQVNVTEGGQAVVAGDTVTRGPGERRRGMIEK